MEHKGDLASSLPRLWSGLRFFVDFVQLNILQTLVLVSYSVLFEYPVPNFDYTDYCL